jgi:hypothetical protein
MSDGSPPAPFYKVLLEFIIFRMVEGVFLVDVGPIVVLISVIKTD